MLVLAAAYGLGIATGGLLAWLVVEIAHWRAIFARMDSMCRTPFDE